jgi:hypothetical protein
VPESIHADTLNAIQEMILSPHYAMRRVVLMEAERIITDQEKRIAILEATIRVMKLKRKLSE